MHPRLALLSSFLCLIGLTMPTAGGPPRSDSYGDPLPDGAAFRIGTARLRPEIKVIPPFVNVLLSPDGKYVFSSNTFGRVVRMWETATGREMRQFVALGGKFSLSADGSILAAAVRDQIHLYDTATGKKQHSIDLSTLGVPKVVNFGYDPRPSDRFSLDGQFLTAFRSKWQPQTSCILRCEIATGKVLGTWPMGKDQPLALSEDGRLAASLGPDDQTIRLWESANGNKIREWKVAEKIPLRDRSLIFSPDNRQLVTAGEDAMIRVYETASGKEVRSWKGRSRSDNIGDPNHVAVGWLAFAPDGKILASVDRNHILRLWDWNTGRELHHFEGVFGPVDFSREGKVIAAGGADSRIRLWDAASGRDLCPFVDPGAILQLAFSPDGQLLAWNNDRGLLRLLDARTGRELKESPGYDLVAFSPDGRSLLVNPQHGDRLEPLCLLDTATGKERGRFLDGSVADHFGGWSADGKMLVMIGPQSVCVYDTATGKKLRELRDKGQSFDARCSPDGRTVAITDKKDTYIRLFATDSGKELRRLTGYSPEVNYAAARRNNSSGVGGSLTPLFAPNGKVLLAGCDRSSFGLWDVASGKRTLRWRCATLLPSHPTFSPDGKWLSLLDTHGDPCLVDTATGQVRHRLAWKGGSLDFLLHIHRAFSSDSRLLAAAYDAHTLVLWETATGRPIRTWPGHGAPSRGGEMRQMIFSPDGRRLATLGRDGTALVWDVTGLAQSPARKLTAAETKQIWNDLADTDAAKAHRAIWMLVADPERALPLLREQLHPASGIDPHRLGRLLADLDSDSFRVREAATQELRKMGELARPALQAAIKDKPSLELRRRVQGLLDEMDSYDLSLESRRVLRAVAVLEHIASADARQLLGVLASGAAGSRLTEEAKASLARQRSRRDP